MAGRPNKRRLDWSQWDVDMFETDDKIYALIAEMGWKGFGLYFFICQQIYQSHGYYIECVLPVTAARLAAKAGAGTSADLVQSLIACCVRIGLFDKDLNDALHVLTSRGIQRRYANAIRDRKDKTVISEYWLLSDPENEKLCPGLVKVSLRGNLSAINSNLSAINGNYAAQRREESIGEYITTTTTTDWRAHVREKVEEGMMAPSRARVFKYMKDELMIDNPATESEKFFAYNELRGWDCLPRWKEAAELWASREQDKK